jgi:cytochrome c553
VVEADTIPHAVPFAFVYALSPAGAREPLGRRIIEAPVSPEAFELRDPRMTFTAYVPRGAVGEGAALAKSGGPAAQPCTICHGAGLRGGVAPPLAGRSPTTMARQLMAFHNGTRANAEAAPMRLIAEALDGRQMIALSAYAATLKP